MEYSPISYMKVRNFRNIADTTIEFNESPIITLLGENEAGKTSIVKAFCVAGLNAFSKKQKNYIREGTNGFGIEIGLNDGSIVQRIKTSASNQLNIKKSDGTIVCANKIDAGSIPVELQSVMGLIEEPETKEYLQVRTYENQLLFVVTPGSTNYKVMYDALKVEQLTKALKSGTEQANNLKREIDEAYTIKKALMENLRKIRISDIEPVVNIKNRLKEQMEKINKLKTAVELKRKVDRLEKEIGQVSLIEKYSVTEIDMTLVSILCNIYNNKLLSDNVNKLWKVYNSLSPLEKIDTSVLEKLNSTKMRIFEKLKNESELGLLKDIEHLKEIEMTEVIKLNELVGVYNRYKAVKESSSMEELNNINEISDSSILKLKKLVQAIEHKEKAVKLSSELERDNEKIKEYNSLLVNSGAMVTNCPNCGETVIVSMDTVDNT